MKLQNLTKAFGGLVAVNHVSFEIEKGEIFGLIGPNGSGKTTTFNCINHYFPDHVRGYFFKGKRITNLKTHKICHLGIGRTFQVVKPLARMSVLGECNGVGLLSQGENHREGERKSRRGAGILRPVPG